MFRRVATKNGFPRPIIYLVTRTHYVQIKRSALPIPFRVISDASVIACAFTVDALQHQTLITDYDTLCDVGVKSFPL